MDFQEQNAQWLTNWITKRKRLLAKNMRKVGFTPYYYSTHDAMPLANEEANQQLKRYEETPIYVGNELPDDLYKKHPDVFLSTTNRPKEESLRKAGTLFSGVNVNQGQQDQFIWFPDNIQSYRSGIHEGTHSTAAVPQELFIEKLNPKKNLLDYSYNDYLDMPTEIYARRNQFARDMNLNPNKRVKRRDIRNWRKQDPFMFNIDFGRYKNKFIKKLFNDVALNDAQTSDVQYVNHGTKLIKKSKFQ